MVRSSTVTFLVVFHLQLESYNHKTPLFVTVALRPFNIVRFLALKWVSFICFDNFLWQIV